MAEFSVRSDSVDVEQIMRQIRARIREKRGVDYTEAELQELAKVKLEKFLDPRGVRSDLVEQFRRHRVVSPEIPKLVPEEIPIYGTHRAALAAFRRILNPILKLFINPNPIIHAIHTLTVQQAHINEEFHGRFRQREEMDPLYYEVVHNLVLEITRLGIEVHNLKMRVESVSSRMDFDERRSRSLERVVEYRPAAVSRPVAGPQGAAAETQSAPAPRPDTGRPDGGRPNGGRPEATARPGSGRPDGGRPDSARPDGARPDSPRPEGEGGRRRRRRRRRRPGQTLGDRQGMPGTPGTSGTPGTPGTPGTTGTSEAFDPETGSARGPREDSESSSAGARASGSPEPESLGVGPKRPEESRAPLARSDDDDDFDDGVDQ
jgi:hypothetical protein